MIIGLNKQEAIDLVLDCLEHDKAIHVTVNQGGVGLSVEVGHHVLLEEIGQARYINQFRFELRPGKVQMVPYKAGESL